MTRKTYEPIVKLAHPHITGKPLATRSEMLWLRDQASMALTLHPNMTARDLYLSVIYIVTQYWAAPMEDDALKSFYRGAKALMKAATETDEIHRGMQEEG